MPYSRHRFPKGSKNRTQLYHMVFTHGWIGTVARQGMHAQNPGHVAAARWNCTMLEKCHWTASQIAVARLKRDRRNALRFAKTKLVNFVVVVGFWGVVW